jgi:uncharacterized membrane protein YgcG
LRLNGALAALSFEKSMEAQMKFWLIIIVILYFTWTSIDLRSDSSFESVLAPLIFGFFAFIAAFRIFYKLGLFGGGSSSSSSGSGGFFGGSDGGGSDGDCGGE